jgi:hypothetical protein
MQVKGSYFFFPWSETGLIEDFEEMESCSTLLSRGQLSSGQHSSYLPAVSNPRRSACLELPIDCHSA